MSKDREALDNVAVNAQALQQMKETFEFEAAAWVAQRLEPYRTALDQSVMRALLDDHSVTDVARAYTVSGKTANRNAIYAIIAAYSGNDSDTNEMPFEWQPRIVKTAKGKRTVYDLTGNLQDFGPENITGEFVWRYDTATGALDPVLTDQNPYPVETKYYKGALARWVENNPYPGEE